MSAQLRLAWLAALLLLAASLWLPVPAGADGPLRWMQPQPERVTSWELVALQVAEVRDPDGTYRAAITLELCAVGPGGRACTPVPLRRGCSRWDVNDDGAIGLDDIGAMLRALGTACAQP